MQPLNGFRDFYPDTCALRNAIVERWRKVARRYGFSEYDGPPLEPLELYTKKAQGDEIVGQLYNFIDKGERKIALRPEMTPTLARMVAARHRDFKKPIKWFSIPQVFRYERPQKGRLREHFQFNCDVIGEAGLEADVELIACLIDILRVFGLTSQDFVVRLSDRQFWIDFLASRGVQDKNEAHGILQVIDKCERESRDVTAKKLGPHADAVFEVLEKGASSERLETVLAGLRQRGLGEFAKIDFKIVRGLAYYTGVVFEAFDLGGEFRAIGGGGRYDHLLGDLCGVPLPALGFGMGDVVLGELLKSRQKTPLLPPAVDAFLVIADEAYRGQAMKLLQQLRDAGVSADYSLAPAKVGKQFELAEGKGAVHAIVVDAKISADSVGFKHLPTRTQKDVPVGELVGLLGRTGY